jgi:hypothetical protein
MRIKQAYVSKSIMDFPFHQIYSLDDYNTLREPAVFFGMYRFEDFCLADQHREYREPIIFWTGQDALGEQRWYKNLGINITAHPKVKKHLNDLGCDCKIVKPAAFLNMQQSQILGKKIYAYCPSSAPDYHGKKVIDELRCGGYEIVIGDGQFSQTEWRNSKADFFYKDIFIGLCLSEFAGGGGSIIEMGLRGIPVVTNVFDLPNCIPWGSLEDVMLAIELETKNIGTINERLSRQVWNDLDHKYKWLEI